MNKNAIKILILPIWLIAAFVVGFLFVTRDLSVGTDTLEYLDQFKGFVVKNLEYLWAWYIAAIRFLYNDFRFFLFISFLIIWFFFAKSACRFKYDTKTINLVLVIFLCIYIPDAFNYLRQCIVGCIWAYYYIEFIDGGGKNLRKISFVSILLCFMHTSSFLLLPLIFVPRLSINRFVAIGLWLLSIIAIITGYLDLLLKSLTFLGTISIMGSFDTLQSNYLTEDALLSGVMERNYNTALLLNIPMMLYLLFYDLIKCDNKTKSLFGCIFVLQIIVNCSQSLEVFNRYRVYLNLLQCVFLPYFIYLLKNQGHRLLSKCLYVAFFLFYISFFIKTYYLGGANNLFNN